MRPIPLLAASTFIFGVFAGALAIRLADRTLVDWPLTATAVKDLMTAVGVVVGGVWVYFLALHRRALATQAKLAHSVQLWALGDREILRVSVHVENKGGVQIRPGSSRTFVQSPPTTIDFGEEPVETWKDIARIEHSMEEDEAYLEPGESEAYSFDIEIPRGAHYLQLHTVVDCKRGGPKRYKSDKTGKRPDDENWDETTLVDLERTRRMKAAVD